jgi:hypothetical protein
MKKLVVVLTILFAASLATAAAQISPLLEPAQKTVTLPHKKNLADMTIDLAANFDVKLIDVTDHLPSTVKVHHGVEIAVVRDPRVNYCCGDLSKTIETIYVHFHNPDALIPPILVYSSDAGGPIVRSFLANRKGTATLEIEVTCRDSSGRRVVQNKTVKIVVH